METAPATNTAEQAIRSAFRGVSNPEVGATATTKAYEPEYAAAVLETVRVNSWDRKEGEPSHRMEWRALEVRDMTKQNSGGTYTRSTLKQLTGAYDRAGFKRGFDEVVFFKVVRVYGYTAQGNCNGYTVELTQESARNLVAERTAAQEAADIKAAAELLARAEQLVAHIKAGEFEKARWLASGMDTTLHFAAQDAARKAAASK